jgi:glycosyltransferase A (GT-A) superfamily protein (DUF2064 family)
MALLHPMRWQPPGVPAEQWRRALVEDTVDLLSGLNEITPAIAHTAADADLAAAVAWPGMPRYEVPAATVGHALRAAAAAGYELAAVLATDAPDLPGLVLGKLLRPLSSRTLALAPALDGDGLLAVASRLPLPDWLPDIDLDTSLVTGVRAAAPVPTEVVSTPGWRRLRDPAALSTLDPHLEGWEATRLLLSPP